MSNYDQKIVTNNEFEYKQNMLVLKKKSNSFLMMPNMGYLQININNNNDNVGKLINNQ